MSAVSLWLLLGRGYRYMAPTAGNCRPDKRKQAAPRRPFQQQKRFLSIHEYLSANLLKTVSECPDTMLVWTYQIQYGIGVPKGEVARSAAEAETIAKQIGTDNLLNPFSQYGGIDM